MTKGQPISHSKPSPAQVTLLTAAVRNNGYLTADLATGRTARTYQACADRGWMTADHRITFAGRDVLRRHDADAYAKALPADHVDIELNRIAARFTGQPTAPLGGPLGSPAHVLAIPDTWIQYDVEPGAVMPFVGYNINTRDGLRMIMDVEYDRDAQGWVDGARIFLSDNTGGIQFTGTVYSEIQVYGPAGGPDLRSNSGKVLDSARRAHEETLAIIAANKAVTVPHTNPDTDRADTLVTTDDVAQLDNAFAGATGSTYADRMPTTMPRPGHGYSSGADGEPVEFTAWQAPSVEAIHDMLTDVTQQMQDRQEALRQHGASTAAEPRMIQVVDEGYSWRTTGNGKSNTVAKLLLDEIVKAGRDHRTWIVDLKGPEALQWPGQVADPEMIGQLPDTSRIRMQPNHGPLPLSPATRARMTEQQHNMQAALSVNAATHVRLAPAVDPGELRAQVEQVRDAIVARIGDHHDIAGQVDRASYRLCLHTARIATGDEAARDALMKLEIALCEIERGATNIARVILSRARRRLARH